MHPQDNLYSRAVLLLGQHLTMDNAVPAIEGCAEAVSRVLELAGYSIPAGGIPNVNGIIKWALNNGFEEIYTPQYGCIITAHSPNVNNPNWAHTGITLKQGIASNNSFGGKIGQFSENYSYEGWDSFFGTIHGSITRYFRPVEN